MPVQLDAALPAELLSFYNRFTALWTSLLDLGQLLAADGAEVRTRRHVVIGTAFHFRLVRR
jgi:hypothetical protein